IGPSHRTPSNPPSDRRTVAVPSTVPQPSHSRPAARSSGRCAASPETGRDLLGRTPRLAKGTVCGSNILSRVLGPPARKGGREAETYLSDARDVTEFGEDQRQRSKNPHAQPSHGFVVALAPLSASTSPRRYCWRNASGYFS